MNPHKHAELIKAWADGAEIEERYIGDTEEWTEFTGDWSCPEFWEYRIKPEPKPDVVRMVEVPKHFYSLSTASPKDNLKLTFDGETGELKSAEVLK